MNEAADLIGIGMQDYLTLAVTALCLRGLKILDAS
jgi:hypothetical protein